MHKSNLIKLENTRYFPHKQGSKLYLLFIRM
jgi:hypothetical protein